ncbi:MAG: hydroxyisourate hydrolase [Rhodobacterales bacterium]
MTDPKGYLTTHVLDTSLGIPAADLQIELYALEGGTRRHICTMQTNADGRTDSPILPSVAFNTGVYELVFQTGDYQNRTAAPQDTPFFLSEIPIRFGINDPDAHYHVPLLLSPFGYSTYRGS